MLTRTAFRELETTVGQGEPRAHLQPIVDLRTGLLAGYEVLARLQRECGKTLLPPDFLPQIEDAGLCDFLTAALLSEVFAARNLPDNVGISVNVSPLQLRNSVFGTLVSDIAHEAGFRLSRLTVEVTESALLEDLDTAKRVLQDLKDLGVRLALDDFGTGHSSLTLLHALPFDELKIDQSFVRSMATRRESRKIVAAVVGLGKSLGLNTVAEGVEDQSQVELLNALGCDLGQGWYFGKPVPATEVKQFKPPSSARRIDAESPDDLVSEACLEARPAERLAQLQAIYHGAPVGLCFLDKDLRYVNLNKRLADMNGLPIREHVGRTVWDVVPAIYEVARESLLRALNGESLSGVELHYESTSAGIPATRLSSYEPARDEAGEIIGVSVAVIDITGRKVAEEKLRESEDHYRHMVQLNPQIPWTMAPDGMALDIGPRWKDFTGQTPEEATGRGWLLALHPDDREGIIASHRQAIETGEPIRQEFRVGRKDGEWHWMRSRGAARRDAEGNIIRWYGSAENIDQEKNAVAELVAAKAKLQAIIDAIPIGIVIAEAPGGRITSRNPAAENILHQDPIAFESASDYARYVTYVRDGRKLNSMDFPLARAIYRGETTQTEVLCEVEGELGKWLSLTGAPIRDSTGAIVAAVATIQEALAMSPTPTRTVLLSSCLEHESEGASSEASSSASSADMQC